ncbi:MAG: TetR family transcriptional regulator [Myxococcota bacterium]|nr:TetR family transcriptional regulator [Myxococcota bacterium]
MTEDRSVVSPESPRERPASASLEASDGRRERSRRSRERILEAIIEALSEESFEPRPEWIAARAGVSVSTVFRLFGSRQAIAEAVGERVTARALTHLVSTYQGDLDRRVDQLVTSMTSVFEAIAPMLRMAERLGYAEMRATGLAELDLLVRAELERALQPDLSPSDADRRDMLALLLSPSGWSGLRSTAGREPEEARALIRRAVRGLLRTA